MGTYSRFLFVLGIVAVTALMVMPRPAQSDAYAIYFESDRDGDTAIYQLTGDEAVRFTEFGCTHPSVTADNSKLLYTHLVETNWGKYWNVFYFVNGAEEKLTRNEIYDELEPVVSHDGTFAAYSSLRGTISTYEQRDTQNMEVFTLSFDASEYQYRITESPKPDENPALAGGSDWVYFTGRTGNFSYIFKAPGDGGESIRLTENMTGWEEHPSVCAAGRFIVYASVVDIPEEEPTDEIAEEGVEAVSDAGYSLPNSQFTSGIPASSDYPYPAALPGLLPYPGMGGGGGTYTPIEEDVETDEDELGEEATDADEFSHEGNSDIWVLDTVMNTRTQLTFDESWEGNPCISADSQVIVFTSDRDGNYEIYRINRDGTGLQRLTENDAVDDFPTIT